MVRTAVSGLRLQWFGRAGISVVDQGAGAVTHLVLHLAAARFLGPTRYGAFALAFAAMLLVLGAHTALVSEPFAVIGPVRHRGSLRAYLSLVLRMHWIAVAALVPTIGCLALLSWAAGNHTAQLLGAFAIAVPAVLTFSLLRRACYVLSHLATALAGSVLYAVVVLGGSWGLYVGGGVTPASLLLLLGVGGAAAGLLIMLALPGSDSAATITAGAAWREHWVYGRWMVAASLASWSGTGAFLFVIAILLGLNDTGVIRAAQNFIGPPQQLQAASALLLLPWLAERTGGRWIAPLSAGEVARAWLPVTLLTAAYCLPLVVAASWLTELVYGVSRYPGTASILPVFALIALAGATTHGMTLSLRSRGRTQPVFWSKLGSSAIVLSVGVWMTTTWGITGASWALAWGAIAEATLLGLALRRR